MNAIPRGAIDITVTGVARRGDAPTIAFVLREKGPNARIPPHAEALLAGLPESGVVDAHAAQTLRGSCGAGGGRSVLLVDRRRHDDDPGHLRRGPGPAHADTSSAGILSPTLRIRHIRHGPTQLRL